METLLFAHIQTESSPVQLAVDGFLLASPLLKLYVFFPCLVMFLSVENLLFLI